ncbi:hypothetical protein UACE39S_05435 [Ureibacillus acetophenoni]
MNSPIIGFIGLGEAAFHITSGLKKEGYEVIYSYDVQADRPGSRTNYTTKSRRGRLF